MIDGEKLVVYTKPECGFCIMLKNILEKNEVEYDEIDVSEDEDALAFIKEQGHQTVPQVYRDGELFVVGGYQGMVNYFRERQEIEAALGDI